MIILAIETSGNVASVALEAQGKIIGEFSINTNTTHSQTLMPMVQHLLKTCGICKTDVGLLAVSSGPGSFTGLRIGAAAAKGLALALSLKIVPVSTLAALAYNIYQENCLIVPIMDAKRNEVYTALYEFRGDDLICHRAPVACGFDDVLEAAKDISKPAIFLGDATYIYADKIKEAEHKIAPAHRLLQSAASVAMFAGRNMQDAINLQEFEISYIRLSQAERDMKNDY
ncbi:MAG: tRNA (adenosine(37)-N6)-threonylcarbamoyltransferase complex dimerization subunit type 1 TsaB [Defluviitaleaceae bacterium]|nr:tRNA (adenosine(37)-N6)-threonylcarbamoyltransferase complex dimerization subunit type 1 TsaB [Defluviitaleaceae bacterium]